MLFKAAGHRHHRSSQFAAGIDVFKTWLYIVHAVGPPNSILVALKLVEGLALPVQGLHEVQEGVLEIHGSSG